jgi:hypothetical protein
MGVGVLRGLRWRLRRGRGCLSVRRWGWRGWWGRFVRRGGRFVSFIGKREGHNHKHKHECEHEHSGCEKCEAKHHEGCDCGEHGGKT